MIGDRMPLSQERRVFSKSGDVLAFPGTTANRIWQTVAIRFWIDPIVQLVEIPRVHVPWLQNVQGTVAKCFRNAQPARQSFRNREVMSLTVIWRRQFFSHVGTVPLASEPLSVARCPPTEHSPHTPGATPV